MCDSLNSLALAPDSRTRALYIYISLSLCVCVCMYICMYVYMNDSDGEEFWLAKEDLLNKDARLE